MNCVRLYLLFRMVAAASLAIALAGPLARAEKLTAEQKKAQAEAEAAALSFGEMKAPLSFSKGVKTVHVDKNLNVYKSKKEGFGFDKLKTPLKNGDVLAVTGYIELDKVLHKDLYDKWKKFAGQPFATIVVVPNLPAGCDITGEDSPHTPCDCNYKSQCLILNPPMDAKHPGEPKHLLNTKVKRETCEPQEDGSDTPAIDQTINLMREGLQKTTSAGSGSTLAPVCMADEAVAGYDLEGDDPTETYGYEGGIKSLAEFDKFLCLHTESPNSYKKEYLPEVKKYVSAVAEALKLPPTYVGCTLLIESSVQVGKVSPAGAVGIAQLMPDRIPELVAMIQPKFQTCDQNYLDGFYKFNEDVNKDLFAGKFENQPESVDAFSRSSMENTAKYGVFGSGLFYRSMFDQLVGPERIEYVQKHPDSARFLFELGVVGYNFGQNRLVSAKRSKCDSKTQNCSSSCDEFASQMFSKDVLEGKKSPGIDWENSCVPDATKMYVRRINDCMSGANFLNYGEKEGANPDPEKNGGVTCSRLSSCGISGADPKMTSMIEYCNKIMKKKVDVIVPLKKPPVQGGPAKPVLPGHGLGPAPGYSHQVPNIGPIKSIPQGGK